MSKDADELTRLFKAVANTLEANRALLNQADMVDANHGDHMVEIFQLATQAAQEEGDADLAGAMERAAQRLSQRQGNGSAQVYAHGLEQFARQFRNYEISVDDLIHYTRALLTEKENPAQEKTPKPQTKSGDILKALMAGMAGWQEAEAGKEPPASPLDMGYLFELGMAYMQAKQRGGSRASILADAAASASPLSRVPHRYLSGKMAIQAFLEAMGSA